MRATEMHRNLREGSPRIAVGAALGLRSGSLASNGGDADVHCGHWVRGGSILREFAIHAWRRVVE